MSHRRSEESIEGPTPGNAEPERRGSGVERERRGGAASEPERPSRDDTSSEEQPPVDETDVLSMGGPDSLEDIERPADAE
jgi:hypothetical protein